MQNKSNNNAPRHFNLTARILHWLMAVAILAMLFMINAIVTCYMNWRINCRLLSIPLFQKIEPIIYCIVLCIINVNQNIAMFINNLHPSPNS